MPGVLWALNPVLHSPWHIVPKSVVMGAIQTLGCGPSLWFPDLEDPLRGAL